MAILMVLDQQHQPYPCLPQTNPYPNSTESETLRVGFNHLCTNSPHYTQVILLKTEMWSTSEPL